MAWSVFARVTGELGTAGYSGFLALHNYNEPLLNPRLDQELARIASAMPLARPAIYTNGDLLKLDRLEGLLAAGVRYVRVTRYPNDASVVPDYAPLRRWMRNAGLLDWAEWEWQPVRQGLAARWQDSASGVLVEVIRPAVAGYNDRGGTAVIPLMPRPRTDPCGMTATSLSIDYRGIVKMCCNVCLFVLVPAPRSLR